jgi:hypothetical protein
MLLSRYAITLIAAGAALTSTAVAAPTIGAGIGAGAGARVGVPSVNVPHVPPAGPAVNAPQAVQQPRPISVPPANANAQTHADARSAVQTGLPLHGTLIAMNGTTATVRFASGETRTYTVSAQTADALRGFVNKPISFRAENDVLSLANRPASPPLHGTLTSFSGTTAVVKLTNGQTHTYTVAANEAAWFSAHIGKSIVFSTNSNGTIALNRETKH